MEPITEDVKITPPKTDRAALGKLNVTVRELTAAQVDAWLNADPQEYPAAFDMMYAKRLLDGDVILTCTDLTPDEMMALPPHCVEQVVAKIRSLNTFFVHLLEESARLRQSNARPSGAPV
jgi:hypothetical protein